MTRSIILVTNFGWIPPIVRVSHKMTIFKLLEPKKGVALDDPVKKN